MVPIIAWPILKNPVKIPRNESPRICKCDLSFSQKGNLSSTGSPHILKWTTISTVNCWRRISSVYVNQSPLAYPGIRAALKMALLLHHLLFWDSIHSNNSLFGVQCCGVPHCGWLPCWLLETSTAKNYAHELLTKLPVLTSHCTSCALLQESPNIINYSPKIINYSPNIIPVRTL